MTNMSDQKTNDTTPTEAFDFRLYRYTPTLPAAIVSVLVFATLTALHIWRLRRARALYFTPFVTGGLCEWSAEKTH